MKKKLLKPPAQNGGILFLPDPSSFLSGLTEEIRIGVCHQPYFFNPGISLKFIFLELFPKAQKKIIFLDTDKVNIAVRAPSSEGHIEKVEFINSEHVLSNFISPNDIYLNHFFNNYEKIIYQSDYFNYNDIISAFLAYKDIFLKNKNKKFLKKILAKSFLEFYNIKREYIFLSDLIKDKKYREFIQKINNESVSFINIFNESIDEYRKAFRFRYKNFPFPKLEEGELPFWLIYDGKRSRCFKRDLEKSNPETLIIFPRAATLTIFLRLYKLDIFIHGIGGGNYEWIQDRIIEKFFKQNPPPYAVISGTFLLENSIERNLPYFLFNPEKIKDLAYSFMVQAQKGPKANRKNN